MGGYGADIVDDVTAFVGSFSAGIIFTKALVQQMYANAVRDNAAKAELAKMECTGVKQRC